LVAGAAAGVVAVVVLVAAGAIKPLSLN